MDPAKFAVCLWAHGKAAPVLSEFYSSTMTMHTTSSHPVHAKYAAKADESWSKHKQWRMAPYIGRIAQDYPLHRKLRLSAYVNKQQASACFVCSLKRQFSSNIAVIIGMARFHEPIRGKGWRKTLQHLGMPVFLIDEYNTSKFCPECMQPLESFKWVKNPRPWQQKKDVPNTDSVPDGDNSKTSAKKYKQGDKIVCHGLRRLCLAENTTHRRLWNRDTAAVLNFRKILMTHRVGEERPKYLQRPMQVVKESNTVPAKRKRAPKKAVVPVTSSNIQPMADSRPSKRARATSVAADLPVTHPVNNNGDSDDDSEDMQSLLQWLLLNN
ncbi:hypothetical protein LPJ64_003160 [Coemansia asiatica]|uniref:Uncharacterized protein n=1 Tax=Coemansia asiatica TaxID=1052880 RepID=A0A9W8CK99_9FUNG|nr:hypothetical protein LPJ64_003160 [Coemansia asiatica]